MFKRGQAGFTLVELIIVMAISSSLAIIALMGFSALRGQAQFSDSVERSVQDVLSQRQEALATVKLSGGGTNCFVQSDQCNITFGKLLTFTPGSSQVKVETLITNGSAAPLASQNVLVSGVAADTSSYTLPWGITFVSAQKASGGAVTAQPTQVAFVRSSVDGTLQTAVSLNTAGVWPGRITGVYQYGDFAAGGGAVNLNLIDPDGRRAYLTVDPANNGVTRTYP